MKIYKGHYKYNISLAKYLIDSIELIYTCAFIIHISIIHFLYYLNLQLTKSLSFLF